MEANLTMEQVSMVKSAALKKVLVEQLQFRTNSLKSQSGMLYSDGGHTNHNDHNDCVCVIGGV
jgi:hypothetical protein